MLADARFLVGAVVIDRPKIEVIDATDEPLEVEKVSVERGPIGVDPCFHLRNPSGTAECGRPVRQAELVVWGDDRLNCAACISRRSSRSRR